MTYPADESGVVRSEGWTYDATSNMATHTNRQGVVQTFALSDNRNRPTSFSWSDGTQGQSFEYDVTSKVTALHNAAADIVNTYDVANRHTSETETIKSYGLYATRSTVSQYDADGNRSRVIYPQGYQFLYGYTQRSQLDNIKLDPAIFGGYYNTPVVQYVYDSSGNHTRRTVLSGAHAEYDIDELNRVRGQSDYFANWQMGRFDYGFDAMGRHRYEQRDWGTADGYQFDPRDELTGYQRDGDLNMDGSVSAAFWNNTTLAYDNNGNRAQVTGIGADSYTVNNLNQYTNDTNTGTMLYDPKGNLTSAAGWTYGYDAQNRLTTIQGPGMTITQTYDPLNRVVTRYVNGVLTQNVWEGWNLIEEHRPDWSIQRCYLQGANQNEMVAAFDGGVYTNEWFWQDGRGNTSHITGDNAALLERYTYDLSGAPTFYDEWGNERWGGSVYDTRFLFAGSQYLPETGLYDMRNRFYSPALNRFLQTDPIGFAGDALNLYRYCGDDPVDRSDPMGLQDHILNDRIWEMACRYDSGNSFQGSLEEQMKRLQPAGNITMAIESKAEAPMRFVPTNLEKNGTTAIPKDQTHTGNDYDYQLSTSSTPPKRVSGVDYTVLEKLSLVPGVPHNTLPKIKQEDWRPLQSNGIFTDHVGLGFRPSRSENKVSVVYQTFELKHNGQPVSVSTRLIHDVHYDVNGQLHASVQVDRP
jgi:RHS repeat-associated protein